MRKTIYRKSIILGLCIFCITFTCTACTQPFSDKTPVTESVSTNEYEGPGVRLEYGSGTVIEIDLVRSLLVIQPDTELPGFDGLPTQITLECEYLDLSAVMTGDRVIFYYRKDKISSDRILINTLLDYGQPAS